MITERRKALLGMVLIGVALAILPFIIGKGLGNAWVRVLDFALLYVMLALGLNIVVGFAGLLDLGYIAFYAVGAYLYALLASPHFGLHWPVWAILPLGALVAGIFGVLLGAPTLRLRGDYLAIVTLGFGEIIRVFLNNLDQPINLTNGPKGLGQIDSVTLFGLNLGQRIDIGENFEIASVTLYYYLFLFLVLASVVICHRLELSRIGRAWVAIREDEIAAAATGINTRNLKLLAFAMGATFGGVAGGLFASFQGFISPESFNLMESIMILCMIVLGGMGHIPGVIFGAVLLTLLPEALRYTGDWQRNLFGQIYIDPADLRMLLFGVALVAVMLYRPAGLFPSACRRQEFADAKG